MPVFLFGFVATLPIATWLVRNHIISGTFTGTRPISSYSLLQNFHSMLVSIFEWYFLKVLFESQIFIALLFLVIGLLIGYLFRKQFFYKELTSQELTPYLLFIIFYIICLFISARSGFWGLIDSRYLTPVFIPITLIFTFIFHKVFTFFMNELEPKIVRVVFGFLILLFFSYPITTTIIASQNLTAHRLGFNNLNISASSTLKYMIAHRSIVKDCIIYTNYPIGVDFIAHFPSKTSPSKIATDYSTDVVGNIEQLKGSWPPEKSCLVWVTSIQDDTLYSITDLEKIATLQVLYSFDDGVIYSIVRK